MTRLVLTIVALLALCSLSQAQLMMRGIGQGDQGGPPPVAFCPNGKLDFSVNTGCQLPFYMLGVQ